MTYLFAVVGNPVLHSKSPAMYNAAFQAMGIDAIYTRLAASSAAEAMETAKAIGIKGINITAPFKEDFAALADTINSISQKIGGINTLIIKSRKTRGFNTDAYGASAALLKNGISLKGKKTIVIGAGGGAKALVLGLISKKADVTVANRTIEKAAQISKKFHCKYSSLNKTELKKRLIETDIIVGAANTGKRVIPKESLNPGMVVLDANYQVKTALIQDAERAGCKIVNSLEWLLYQGALAFELFTKNKAPIAAMQKALYSKKKLFSTKNNIALIGLMGSGKSTIAKVLSKLTNMPVIDIDAEIEKKSGKKISYIFEKYGEERFRKMERKEIAGLRNVSNSIISCGGGAVLNGHNTTILKKNALVIWLWANPETIVKRVGKDKTRPLFNIKDKKTLIYCLLQRRIPLYAKASHIIVPNNHNKPEKAARLIMQETGKVFHHE